MEDDTTEVLQSASSVTSSSSVVIIIIPHYTTALDSKASQLNILFSVFANMISLSQRLLDSL